MMHKTGYLKIFYLILCCVAGFNVSAQVKYGFTRDTLEIKGGETFSNLLKITNFEKETVTLLQDRKEKPLTRGLISLPDSLVLKAGESKVFPLKYIADRQTINNNSQIFTVHLTASNPRIQVQKSAAFQTQLTDVGGLTIGTEEDEVYLGQLSNQAQVVVRCANNGFVPITFRLLLSGIPDGLEFIGQTMNLTLQPGTQQLLPFLARNKINNRIPADFTVTIQAVDAGNHPLAVKMIRIVNVTNARRMSMGSDQYAGSLSNTIALRYASLSSNSSFYQLQANGKVKTGDNASLEYRLNADQYHQQDVNGINIYNTYVDYQAKSWGVKVGNIYENIDFSLGGRGIKGSLKMKDNGVLSVYGIQNNFLLYDQINTTISGAKILAVDYNLATPDTRGDRRLTYIHSRDSFTGIDANQLSMKAGVNIGKGQLLDFEAGYSLEGQNKMNSSARQGASAGMNYALNTTTYQFAGSGYYSTPYFTGLRRGLLLTDLRLTRKFENDNSFAAHFSMQVNSPKYQYELNNIFNTGINKNAIYIYELGFNTRAGNVFIGFGPYFMDQHLITSAVTDQFGANADWRSSSMRFSANLAYSGRIHSFSMTADYGYTYVNTSERPTAPFHSVKINTSYNLPILGFSSYIQLNPYYISDILSSNGTNQYRLYSFGPNIHFEALQNNLNFRLGGMYNYYGFTHSNNYSVNSNIRYLLKGNWALTSDLQYTITRQKQPIPVYNPVPNTVNSIDNLYFENRQLRFGVEKQFGAKGGSGTKRLLLTYYEDHNSNGQRDPGEAPVAGVLVKINGEAALTNSKGIVEFKDMKKEAYTVTVTNTRGWSLQDPTVVFLDKSKKLEIPLVKTQALNGCLKLKAEKYGDGAPVLAGIRINAADPNGRIHQTLTDDQGNFCFYLPRNKYTVYIETAGMPFSIENEKEEVSLQGIPVGMLTFLYHDQRRKVTVSRF
ncbi:collagen binding domain-containing protein [Pedobacter cryoconitis]|uniref:MSCRAMM family protein n=1 Tax=Pedobacter cryoconitis TaxID=188932 RepID=UPI0016124A81|nr:SdrD B-like domain-containing protein [Pedobacter cryoconitis]